MYPWPSWRCSWHGQHRQVCCGSPPGGGVMATRAPPSPCDSCLTGRPETRKSKKIIIHLYCHHHVSASPLNKTLPLVGDRFLMILFISNSLHHSQRKYSGQCTTEYRRVNLVLWSNGHYCYFPACVWCEEGKHNNYPLTSTCNYYIR